MTLLQIIYLYRDPSFSALWTWNSAQYTFCIQMIFMLLIVVTPAFEEIETAGGFYKDMYGGAAVVEVKAVDNIGTE